MRCNNLLRVSLDGFHYFGFSGNERSQSRLECITWLSTILDFLLSGFGLIKHALKFSCFCLCDTNVCLPRGELLHQIFMFGREVFILRLDLLADERK